jgi:predicted AAA+ superfamily ATPase
VLNTVLVRDILERYQIRNGALLSDMLRYVASNIGYPTSTNKMARHLRKERTSLAFETVREYLGYFRNAFFIDAPAWSDILGKKHLELHEKYYFTDIGIRNGLVGYRDEYLGQILENVVYNELVFRGYSVKIGRIGSLEVDFVAEKPGEKLYVQVAYLLSSPETADREFAPLEKIPDNYRKMVLSMDADWGNGRNGIERKQVEDWLLEG